MKANSRQKRVTEITRDRNHYLNEQEIIHYHKDNNIAEIFIFF
jgi:hypothetical protein